MSQHKLIILALAIALPFATACKKKEKAGEPGATAGETAGKAPAAATPTWTPIPNLGLTIEMPGPAEVSDTSGDAPAASVSAGDISVPVATATEAYASTYEAAKKEIEKDPNTFKSFTKDEQFEGGWHLEYELESMSDKATLYGVKVRHTIDGKQYECGRNERSKDVRDAIAKACRTLKKA